MTLVRLDGASMERGARLVLDDVTWCVRRGERYALWGENGAGKSSLLRVLAGLDTPSSGSVWTTRPFGYMPQGYAETIFPWFSVLKNVAMPRLATREASAFPVARRLCAALLPGIDDGRPAGRLSGGEKQALALARALAWPGDLLLLDEPFSAMSAERRLLARRVVVRELGSRALVLVTHDPEDVAALATRVLRLCAGKLDRSAGDPCVRGAAE